MRSLTIALLAAGLTASHATAQISIDFTSEALGPIHGRTIQGVTFGYFVGGLPSLDANVGGGPGCIVFVCDPSLEGGSAGMLTMSFLRPLSFLSFGLAMNTTLNTTAFVQLFDPTAASIGIFALALSPQVLFSEALFSYTGGPLVSQAHVTFADPNLRFALDNIEGTVVPEPATMILLGSGLLGLAGAARRRRREASQTS